jgi:hypothetical protein
MKKELIRSEIEIQFYSKKHYFICCNGLTIALCKVEKGCFIHPLTFLRKDGNIKYYSI